MLASVFRSFWRDRRAVTALTFALMLTPMIIAAGAAVDFARLASSRAQLQAAVDGAALSAVGAYANEENGATAISVGKSAFNAAYSGISGAVSLASSSPSATVGCTATGTSQSTECGSTGTGITESSTACSAGTWCATVTATATQTNLLFYHLGSEKITVTATSVWGAGTAGTGNGTTNQFGNFVQADYSSNNSRQGNGTTGQVGWEHTSGMGAGSASSSLDQSSSGNAFFLDGFNNAAPTFLTYSSLPQPTGSGCNSPNFSTGSNSVLLVGTDTVNCNLPLGNPPTEEWYYIDGTANSGSWINVPNGTVNVAPDTIICPEHLAYSTYSGNGVNIAANCNNGNYNKANSNGGYGYYTPIYLGGSLVLGYNVSVTPSTTNSGLITFVNDEYDTIKLLNSNASVLESSYICPEGQTTCGNNATLGNSVSVTGPATYTSHDTYVTTITVKNGLDVAWTETETFATQYTKTQQTCTGSGSGFGNNQQCTTTPTTITTSKTETAEVGGGYNGTAPVNSVGPRGGSSSSYSPSPFARDPTTDTSGLGDTNSSGVSTDAYGQLDTACSGYYNPTTGESVLGGNQSVSGASAPISVTGPTANIFAMTTDAPPSQTPPSAYNFTYPNYGYSYVNANEQGSALETETVYFCGIGPSLSVSGGSATGLTVAPSPASGASLIN